MKYLIIIEKTEKGYSAYSQDLSGVVAAGFTQLEVDKSMQEAIKFHLEGLKAEGEEIPLPSSYSTYLDIEAA